MTGSDDQYARAIMPCGCKLRLNDGRACRLHAAAPKLVAALHDLVQWVEAWNPDDGTTEARSAAASVRRARAILAAAEDPK